MKSFFCRQNRKKMFLDISNTAVLLLVCIFVAGCFPRSQPPPEITRLSLDHSRAALEGFRSEPLTDETIAVIRFSSLEECRGTTMLYSDSPGERNLYRYHRWHTNLPTMVTEWVISDLSRSDLFHAVFTEYAYEKSRFVLEGRVTECLAFTGRDRPGAILGFTATLVDQKGKGPSERVLFQKSYRHESMFDQDSPQGFAGAMSAGMAVLSAELLRDIVLHLEGR